MVTIRTVESKADLQAFVELPFVLNAGNPNWVPPLRMMVRDTLDRKKNPFYEQAASVEFLAEVDGQVVGRLSVIDSGSYKAHTGTNTGFFGFLESVDDPRVTRTLFRVAEDWATARGLGRLIGPFSPNMMGEVGILVEGYDRDPSMLMPYNAPHYEALMLDAGYAKVMDLLAYKVTRDTINRGHIEKAEALLQKRYPSISVRPVNLRDFKREARIIGDIFNRAWARNWGFAPLSENEFAHLAADLKLLIDPTFAHVAEDNGVPVAFNISIPNYNPILKKMNGNLFPTGIFRLLWERRKVRELRVALMGVVPEYQGRGIDQLVVLPTLRAGWDNGYQAAEMSWLLETNTPMVNVAEKVGGFLDKRYRVFEKPLVAR